MAHALHVPGAAGAGLARGAYCGECGGPVDALLTVAGTEWDGPTDSWRPVECGETAEEPPGRPHGSLHAPTMVTIGRGYSLQFYTCVGTPTHPPRIIMQ
ncbi:hypothetical protein [Actinacidiphila acidipaludis]|uniref:Uncharacterized protein n=1 Tax=Actinacidiphila acidipaludis TaxID=2873382 RepID=A0ABS7QGH7_9ACTN|nr:hypothetical protein [Streptomyces acidipaludis]MBY8882275.1 hypothetical protein [Streptomyces acidipaludis]